jgi:acetoin utilization deacetylase AcuC-like enzyme
MARPYGIRVSRTVWLRHQLSLAHEVPRHPERPERILALEAEMQRHDWFGCDVLRPAEATREQLLAVHPASHIDFIEELCASGGGHIDYDTVAMPATYEAAVRAAGGAVRLVDELVSGDAATGFSAMRPPGHHAEPAQAMGFCFFGNVAVAARHAAAAHDVERVLILDWDVHHGNGTNAIFHADPSVLFVSLHESPLYPGTGPASDLGSGAGEGYTVNLPVPGGSGDETYRSLVDHVVLPLIAAWEPGLVLVSAGFDAHVLDPLATCRVTERGYAEMTASLRRACAAVGAPVGLVLEGGYSLEALTGSVAALMPVLIASSPPAAGDDVAVHPLAVAAADRLAPWWPGVALAQRGTTRRA